MADEYTRLIEVIEAQTKATIVHTTLLTTMNGKLSELLVQGHKRERMYLLLIVFLIVSLLTTWGITVEFPSVIFK